MGKADENVGRRDGTARVERAKCPGCGQDIILAHTGQAVPEAYSASQTRMLVVLAFPMLEGQKRVALGPCQPQGDLHGGSEEPVVYFGHVRHICPPTQARKEDFLLVPP